MVRSESWCNLSGTAAGRAADCSWTPRTERRAALPPLSCPQPSALPTRVVCPCGPLPLSYLHINFSDAEADLVVRPLQRVQQQAGRAQRQDHATARHHRDSRRRRGSTRADKGGRWKAAAAMCVPKLAVRVAVSIKGSVGRRVAERKGKKGERHCAAVCALCAGSYRCCWLHRCAESRRPEGGRNQRCDGIFRVVAVRTDCERRRR